MSTAFCVPVCPVVVNQTVVDTEAAVQAALRRIVSAGLSANIEPDDLAQEARIALLTQRADSQGHAFTIAKHAMIDHMRSERRRCANVVALGLNEEGITQDWQGKLRVRKAH